MEQCICLKPQRDSDGELLERFANLRSHCPALNQIFIPDADWPTFQQWHRNPDTVAWHQSSLLLAMKSGCLERITSPVHRYLLAGRTVRKQYLQDLRELWMLNKDPIERHKRSRVFDGRVAELQFAEYLETQGWKVTSLEALDEGPDIKARAHNGRLVAFEVKFIGIKNDDFAEIVKSLAGEPSGGSVSIPDAADTLLNRVDKAANQLQWSSCERIVVLIIQDATLFRYEFPLRFNFCNDIQPALKSIKSVWILTRSGHYIFHREFEIPSS